MGKIRLDKKIETGKKQKKDRKICFTPHKWLICMLAARSAGPATAAIAAAAAAATTRATLGGQVSLGHPLVKNITSPEVKTLFTYVHTKKRFPRLCEKSRALVWYYNYSHKFLFFAHGWGKVNVL